MTTHQAIFFFFLTLQINQIWPKTIFVYQLNIVFVKHTSNNTYTYIDLCIHIHRQKLLGKKLPVNLKPHCHTYTQKNIPKTHLHRRKITVSETQNHSDVCTCAHTHTQWQKHIKYQRGVKQTKVNTLRKKRGWPLYKTHNQLKNIQTTNKSEFKSHWVPINKALCHICSLIKATSWKHIYVCKNKINKLKKIQISLWTNLF